MSSGELVFSLKFECPLYFALFSNGKDRLHVTPDAYVVLASIFNVSKTTFSYGDFGKAMEAIGFVDHSEVGVLSLGEGEPRAQTLAYNPALLPLDTVVTREVQDIDTAELIDFCSWRDHVEQWYGWCFPCFTTE
ncbi:hypothetical protein C8T65DRAFT_694738 [Cerioporus squamosus]|nr:hypothetical protein C8T65DRAFT_694738 [Cerioporus squamosus]